MKLTKEQEKYLNILDERNEAYKKDSMDFKWFMLILAGVLLITSLLENL